MVLYVALLLGRVNDAEPNGMSGAVGPTVAVEFHIPVPLVCDGMEKEADAVVGLLVFTVDDEFDEAEVLGWLDEVGVVDVTEEAEVLDDAEVEEVVEDKVELGLGKADVVDV